MGKWKCGKCNESVHTDFGEYLFIRHTVVWEIASTSDGWPGLVEYMQDEGRSRIASLCPECKHVTWIDECPFETTSQRSSK